MPTLDQQRAAQILLERRQARRDMVGWARKCGYEPAKHHLFLIEKLEQVLDGKIKKLMISMPPGSAKSTYTTMLLPGYYLSRNPGRLIITASGTSELADYFGRRARALVLEHSNVLGYSLRPDSRAIDEWATTNGGEYKCAGVGKSIVGRRADLGLIDDPVPSREAAYSKVESDKTWEWYKYDFITRLKPEASQILIQTRWHENDLAGRILATEADEWVVINLPMLAKENDPLGRMVGQPLWPEYFTEAQIRDAKKDQAKWSALYQGDPTPQDGDYFQRSWIEDNAYEPTELPPLDELKIYVASDHAVSEKEHADSTCMIPVGVDKSGVIWVLPFIYWNKCSSFEAVEQIIAMLRRYRPITWWMENEKITKSFGPFLKRAMREQGVYAYIEPVTPSRDKQTRAQSIRGRFQSGMVRFPRKATWYNDAVLQLLKFPAGAHDDFIDPLAYIGLGLDRVMTGNPKPIERELEYGSPPITLGRLKREEHEINRIEQYLLLNN